MRTPGSRLIGALLVLALYQWGLVGRTRTDDSSSREASLQANIEKSQRLFAAGRFADALEPTLLLATELGAQPVYLDRLARIYERLDRPLDEAGAWERLMDASATPADACPMVVRAFERAKDDTRALAAAERCVEAEPDNPDWLLVVAQAYARAQRGADARRVLERALTLNERYPDVHLVLGIRDFADGRVPDARAHFERFVELAPGRRDEAAVWLERTRPPR